MPQIPVQPARQGAPQCELNSIHICTNVLFCFVLFDFVFILLFFAGVLPLSPSLSLSDFAHPRVKVEAKPEAAHTMLIVALQLEHVLLNATHTLAHTLARVVPGPTCRISYIKLLSPRHVCCDMCVRKRESVCVCVCVQLGQFKRRRRRRPCKGLHAHLPDSFHCGDLLCEAPVAFCGCVSHKQTTANTHTHTHERAIQRVTVCEGLTHMLTLTTCVCVLVCEGVRLCV